jgi:hypothetical protein
VSENTFTDADRDSLLAEHVQTLADLHEVEGDQTADPTIVEAVRAKAKEAEDVYLRARDLPSTDD